MLIVALQDDVDNLYAIWNTVTDRFLGVNLGKYEDVGTIMDYKEDCTFEEALDRVEHPQPFYDIAECICDELKAIERERLFYKNKLMDLRLRCHDSARNIFDSGNYGVLHIVTANELKSYNN